MTICRQLQPGHNDALDVAGFAVKVVLEGLSDVFQPVTVGDQLVHGVDALFQSYK